MGNSVRHFIDLSAVSSTDLRTMLDDAADRKSRLKAGEISRPFVAPPDIPADRAKMVRDAFKATMKDPDFIADTKKQKLDVEPEDGEHLAALIKKIYATPKPIVDKIVELIK